MSANQEYNREVKKKILEYIMSHKIEDNQWTNIRNYLADDRELCLLRSKRNYKKGKEDFSFDDDRFDIGKHRKKFDNITTVLLKELEAEKKIEKRKIKKGVRFYAGRPTLSDLKHGEIVLVKSNHPEILKTIIDDYKLDKKLIVVPIEGHLVCTLKNVQNDKQLQKYKEERKKKIDDAMPEGVDILIDINSLEAFIEKKITEKEQDKIYERDYILKCVRKALKIIDDSSKEQ